jgi:hypothetical protein
MSSAKPTAFVEALIAATTYFSSFLASEGAPSSLHLFRRDRDEVFCQGFETSLNDFVLFFALFPYLF